MPQPNIYTSPSGNGTSLDSRDVVSGFFEQMGSSIASAWAPAISVEVPTAAEVTNFTWLGSVPIMREWVGGRHEHTLAKYTYSVRTKLFEATLPMSVEDLRRDQTGQLRMKAAQLGERAGTHWDTLLAPLIVAGEAGTQGFGYDGQAYFDTDHNESGTNQSNDLTATEVASANVVDPNAPTPTEAANIVTETTSYMMSLTDDQGEPINQTAMEVLILVTKPAHLSAFTSATKLNMVAGNVDNPILGFKSDGWTYRVAYTSRMTAANKIYFFFGGPNGGAALIRVNELDLVTQLVGAGSDEEFRNNRHVFGVKAVRGVGFGQWQKAALVTLS